MEDKLNELSYRNALLFGVVLAVAYYFFIFQPTDVNTQLSVKEQELAEVNGLIAAKNKKIKKKQTFELEKEQINEGLKHAKAFLPDELSGVEAVKKISERARMVGLSIESIAADGQWKEDLKTVSFLEVSASFAGSFENIMYFLSDLTREKLVLSLTSLIISESSDGGSSEQDVVPSEELSMRVAIRVYKSKPFVDETAVGEDGV